MASDRASLFLALLVSVFLPGAAEACRRGVFPKRRQALAPGVSASARNIPLLRPWARRPTRSRPRAATDRDRPRGVVAPYPALHKKSVLDSFIESLTV
jgi:hypothetical protein